MLYYMILIDMILCVTEPMIDWWFSPFDGCKFSLSEPCALMEHEKHSDEINVVSTSNNLALFFNTQKQW